MSSFATAQDARLAAFSRSAPPPAPREFRAVWIASIGNLQWPRPNRSVEQQKQDMIDLLDKCVALNLNAVIVQIRPGADALYKSDLEPWSDYLTGVQGQAPNPYYDPMELWITECHRRGLEFHAWFNPYRVSPAGGKFAANSIMRTHPEIVRTYGTSLWMDPGEPLATQHTLAVLKDIVTRYDIDGLHTDDYYYPYRVTDKSSSKPVDFPDADTYKRYKQAGGKLALDDWRRNNINHLVEQIYTQTRQIKPSIKIGYAPFGIWKKDNPPGIKGMSQMDVLYSDPKLWLQKGWLDYLAPQLYWHIGGEQDFKSLFNWWLAQDTQHRHLWPGVNIGKNGDDEILDQIKVVRSLANPGTIFWNVSGLTAPRQLATLPREYDTKPGVKGHPTAPWRAKDGEDLGKALVTGPYTEKAIIPPSPWLDHASPAPPIVTAKRNNDSAVISLEPGAGESTFVYAIYVRYGNSWRFTTLPGGAPSITLNADPTSGPATQVVVSAVDRTGNESLRATIQIR